MKASIGEKRFWTSGLRVQNRSGARAMFIATWAQYAWVVFDGEANPQTVLLTDLVEDEYANSLCERLHVGANETGILYYDRGVKGDWFLIARLPYSTLALEIRHPESELLPFIQEEAKKMQAKRGDPWKCSATGKAVILGQPHP